LSFAKMTEKDLEKYIVKPGSPFMPYFFLDENKPNKQTIAHLKSKL